MKKTDSLHGVDSEVLAAKSERRAEGLFEGLKVGMSAFLAENTRPKVGEALSDGLENTMPKLYGEQYDLLPEDIRRRCEWKSISVRLLERDGEMLKKVEAMRGGGELVGIDAKGRAMFKDKGVEPVLYGFDKGGELVRIYDRDPRQMNGVEKWANYNDTREQISKDGYELFADDGNHGLSDEMRQVQDHTKEPFVASENRREFRLSWLESGNNTPRYADYSPVGDLVRVYEYDPLFRDDLYGAVRLLRV